MEEDHPCFFDLRQFKKRGHRRDRVFEALEHLRQGCERLNILQIPKGGTRVWFLGKVINDPMYREKGLAFALIDQSYGAQSHKRIWCNDQGRLSEGLISGEHLKRLSRVSVFGVMGESKKPYIDTYVVDPNVPGELSYLYGPNQQVLSLLITR